MKTFCHLSSALIWQHILNYILISITKEYYFINIENSNDQNNPFTSNKTQNTYIIINWRLKYPSPSCAVRIVIMDPVMG